jgi:hypothetical protein
LADRIEIEFRASKGSLVERALLEETKNPGMICTETLCLKLVAVTPDDSKSHDYPLGEAGNFSIIISKKS